MEDSLIYITNLKSLSPELGYIDIRVDRASVLGNPFELTTEADRDKVSDAYDEWLAANLQQDVEVVDLQPWIDRGLKLAAKFKKPSVLQVRKELWRHVSLLQQDKKLRYCCWCKQPNKTVRCHADSIKKTVLYNYQRVIKLKHL